MKAKVPLHEIEKYCWDRSTKQRLVSGAKEFVEFLLKNDIKTGIISNAGTSGYTLQAELQKHLNFYDYFEFLISTADYGVIKPMRAIFEVGIKRIGFESDEIIYIGDSPRNDMVGPTNAGMHCCWRNFRTHIHSDLALYEFVNYDDLQTFFEEEII